MLHFGPEIEQQFPLPDRPHRPGQNARPVADLRAPVSASVDVTVTADNWARHEAYLYGFVLYRAGYYWEAHEIWEPVWMRCAPNSIERLLLQAVIQLANAALKSSQGNSKASARLYDISRGLLCEVMSRRTATDRASPVLGVDVDDLEQEIKKMRYNA